jgi:RHS repeat-associated protein
VRVQGDPNPSANGVFYTLGDHLGSSSLVADSAGAKVSETRYMPWGETRYTSGYQPSDYLYTGQRAEAGIGLYYYNARWYDPSLGRFAQADTMIPDVYYPSKYDHFSYAINNPLIYIDPSGHDCANPSTAYEQFMCEGGTSTTLNNSGTSSSSSNNGGTSSTSTYLPNAYQLSRPDLDSYSQDQGHNYDCGDTTISMACNMYFDHTSGPNPACDVNNVAKFLDSSPLYRFGDKSATSAGVSAALEYLGIPFYEDLGGSIEQIDSEVASGNLVIASVGNPYPGSIWGHVKLIAGADNQNYTILDPDSGINGGGAISVTKTTFEDSWWVAWFNPGFHPMWVIGHELDRSQYTRLWMP